MEYTPNHTQNSYEHIVRGAVLAQLTNDKMVDAITTAVLARLEDQQLLQMLKEQDISEQELVSSEQFIEALRSSE